MEFIVLWMGQDNTFQHYVTIIEAQKTMQELHEGFVGEHFVVDINVKKILSVGYWWPMLFIGCHKILQLM